MSSRYTLVRGGHPDDELKCWSEIRCDGVPMCDEDIVTALEQVPQWVSVEERLPDDDLTVLVWIPDRDVVDYTGAWLGYHEGDKWVDAGSACVIYPTHWMELPEGPDDA